MTREDIMQQALNELNKKDCLCLELATGAGKTRIALACINKICEETVISHEKEASILILVAKTVHKDEWRREMEKWGGVKTKDITIECYESLRKHAGKKYTAVIGDEAHHLSEARREILENISFGKLVLLSATMPKDLKEWFKWRWSTSILTLDLPDAIKEDILPEPTIWLLPLYFDSNITEEIVKNGGRHLPIRETSWNQRWNWIKRRDFEIHIHCTKAQYLEEFNSQIEWFKSKAMAGAEWARFKWLRLCKDRLEWLSSCKNPLLLALLRKLSSNRTITFCSTIEQAELLGRYCIHSKNGLSQKILNAFNNKDIDHITAVNILNEGVNITDCQVGIFANVTASEIITKQRSGRLLRHKHPIMIMPYYKGTREEELVMKHLQGYNPELIKYARNINDIDNYNL